MKVQVRGLIDTGAILALLDTDDSWHERCVEAFSSLKLPLATTAAVLAELFHLLGEHPNNLNVAWKLLRSGAICVLPITDAETEKANTASASIISGEFASSGLMTPNTRLISKSLITTRGEKADDAPRNSSWRNFGRRASRTGDERS